MFEHIRKNGKKTKVYSSDFREALMDEYFEDVVHEFDLYYKDLKKICDSDGNTLLHLAAELGESSVLSSFHLRYSIPVNVQNNFGDTALTLALQHKNPYCRTSVAQYLLGDRWRNEEADVTIKNKKGQGPLYFCREFEDSATFKLICIAMIKKGFTKQQLVNAMVEVDCPLYMSVFTEDIEVVKLVYAQRGNIDEFDKQGRSAVHAAIHIQNKEILEYLIQNGAKLNLKTEDGMSLLHWIVSSYSINKYIQVLEVLLQNGFFADSCIEDKKEKILREVAMRGNLEIVKFFLNINLDISTKDSNNNGVLHFAAENSNVSVMKFFLNYAKLDIDEKNLQGKTSLFIAADRRNTAIIEFLLKRGVDVNIEDDDGVTPLFSLITSNYFSFQREDNKETTREKLVQLLLDHGADINKQTHEGATVLSECISKEKMDLVRLLLRHIAKLELIGMPTNESYLKLINEDEQLYVYYTACKYELLKMKDIKLFEDISLLSVLTSTLETLVNYVRNDELVRSFEDIDLSANFRLYHKTLRNKYDSCVEKQRMISHVSNLLMFIFSIDNSLVIHTIMGYLYADDLESLYEVAKGIFGKIDSAK